MQNYTVPPGLNAIAQAAAHSLTKSTEMGRFRDRGFSDRTIQTLIEAGYIYPEHLLFAQRSELQQIKGIGPKSLKEIYAYRKRFEPLS